MKRVYLAVYFVLSCLEATSNGLALAQTGKPPASDDGKTSSVVKQCQGCAAAAFDGGPIFCAVYPAYYTTHPAEGWVHLCEGYEEDCNSPPQEAYAWFEEQCYFSSCPDVNCTGQQLMLRSDGLPGGLPLPIPSLAPVDKWQPDWLNHHLIVKKSQKYRFTFDVPGGKKRTLYCRSLHIECPQVPGKSLKICFEMGRPENPAELPELPGKIYPYDQDPNTNWLWRCSEGPSSRFIVGTEERPKWAKEDE